MDRLEFPPLTLSFSDWLEGRASLKNLKQGYQRCWVSLGHSDLSS